jgi:hypothetical protein
MSGGIHMTRSIGALVILTGALALVGCTNSEPFLRPGLAVNYPVPSPPGGNSNPDAGLPLMDLAVTFNCIHLLKASPMEYVVEKFSSSGPEPLGCLYKYVEVNDLNVLLKLDDDTKAKIKLINLVISFTRQNCNTFMARMFANREGLTYWQKLINDFAAAGSGAAAFASPFAAAAISTANITINHAMDAASQTYYQVAQQIFETTVSAAMQKDETIIEGYVTDAVNGTKPYSIMKAVADLDDYGRDCSIDRGLQFANTTVQINKDTIYGVLGKPKS